MQEMSKTLVFILIALRVALALKCSYVFDDKNEFKIVQCRNLKSMVDVASEIQSNWTAVEIVNDSNHTEFTNTAGNIQ